MLRDIFKPGIDTFEIETKFCEYTESCDEVPLQIGFEELKYATTISINDEVARGLPRKGLKLKNSDLVKIDTVVGLDSAVSYSVWSYAVGEVTPEIKKMMVVAKKEMYLGVD